jgi:DUF1680 family protein
MEPYYLQPNPRADALRGCLAIQRGPLVFCLEQADQPEGLNMLDVVVSPHQSLQDSWRGDLLEGVVTVQVQGFLRSAQGWQDDLYQPYNTYQTTQRNVALTAVPYYAWANRGAGAMRVWIPAA